MEFRGGWACTRGVGSIRESRGFGIFAVEGKKFLSYTWNRVNTQLSLIAAEIVRFFDFIDT